MKKIIASGLISMILLSSCGKATETAVTTNEKESFSVSVRTITDFPTSYTIKKTGRMVGSSNIALASQWVGRVDAVLVKEGMSVKKWQLLVQFKDTTANYDLKLSQANNNLSSARNNTESARMTLEKAINDTKLALDRAENDLRTVELTTEKNLEKAVRDSEKSKLGNSSDATVSLDQLKASLDKAKLDRENLIIANKQTIANYVANYGNTLNDLKKFYAKIIFEEDRRYGFTPKFQEQTTFTKTYLGARLPETRNNLEVAYGELEKNSSKLAWFTETVDETNLVSQLTELGKMYQAARAYFNVSGKYLENSITSSSFPQTQLDGYIAINNGYKTELSWLESAETAFQNSVSTFLANYKNNESSASAALTVQEKNIEVQTRQLQTNSFDSGISLDKLRANNEQMITTSKIAVESARLAYENAKENKIISLKKLSLAESDASLSVSQAQEEFSRLSILAPIDGSITKVIASVGQDVNNGTPIIELANRNPEITFDAEASIVPLLKVGSTQIVKYQDSSYTGTIIGVSQVATDSLLYSARITLPNTTLLLGQVASIELKLPSLYPVLPTDIIKVISDKKWEIQTLSWGTIVPLEVELGRIAWDRVEIISKINPSIQIITSNVLNFDAKKSKIVVEKSKK